MLPMTAEGRLENLRYFAERLTGPKAPAPIIMPLFDIEGTEQHIKHGVPLGLENYQHTKVADLHRQKESHP